MESKISKEACLLRAKKRIEELKGFYVHFGVYICVNVFLTVKHIYGDLENGFTFTESILEISSYGIWVFWGIGVIYHALKVFSFDFLLGKNWEDRKIKEYMNKNNTY